MSVRRITKLPNKYKPKRLPAIKPDPVKEVQQSYPDLDIEVTQKPSKGKPERNRT